MRSLLLPSLFLFALAACADDEPDPVADAGIGGGVVRDATAGSDAAPNADAVANPDADEEEEDAGEGEDDATVNPDASPAAECSDPAEIDGVIFGPIYPQLPHTVLATRGVPAIVSPIAEASDYVALSHARITPAGLAWSAQISSLTQFDSLQYEHFLIDPSDGALFVAVEMQVSDTAGLRFYNADGTLFREYTPGGPAESELIGRSRQSNFFLVKYNGAGDILWVTRFGPNSNGERAGQIMTIGFVGDNVRVVGTVEGGTTIAFNPGTPASYEHTMPAGSGFWADVSRSTGEYVANTARFIAATDRDSAAVLGGSAKHAHNASGTAILARLTKESQPAMETFTIGSEGAMPITVTATRSTLAAVKIGADGAPQWAGTVAAPALFGDGPDPRAVGIGPNGEVVAGAQFSGSESRAIFRGTSGVQTIDYVGDNSFIVAFDSDGALRWVTILASIGRNAVSRLFVSEDAVYVVGSMGVNDQIGSLRVPANGYTFARLSLATGAAEWVRVFTPSGVTQADAYSAWFDGPELVVPSAFTGVTIAGADGSPTFTNVEPLLGALYFEEDGDFLRCEAVALGVRDFRPF